MSQNELKLEIQRYAFSAHDMQLYLDTHPTDTKAFKLFKALTQKSEELKTEYERKYGPLDVVGAANGDCYVWLESPWPWEKGGNA